MSIDKKQKGRFYWHKDNSKVGIHPSMVVRDKGNKYDIVCFTSSNGPSRKKLVENIDSKNRKKDCYVLNKPSRDVKKKFLKDEIPTFSIRNSKDRKLIKKIKNKKRGSIIR